jgi:hypothetical protein
MRLICIQKIINVLQLQISINCKIQLETYNMQYAVISLTHQQ